MQNLRQKAAYQRFLLERTIEKRYSDIIAPRRAANGVEADVSRLIAECEARAPPFELGEAIEEEPHCDAEDDAALFEAFRASLQEELEYLAAEVFSRY